MESLMKRIVSLLVFTAFGAFSLNASEKSAPAGSGNSDVLEPKEAYTTETETTDIWRTIETEITPSLLPDNSLDLSICTTKTSSDSESPEIIISVLHKINSEGAIAPKANVDVNVQLKEDEQWKVDEFFAYHNSHTLKFFMNYLEDRGLKNDFVAYCSGRKFNSSFTMLGQRITTRRLEKNSDAGDRKD